MSSQRPARWQPPSTRRGTPITPPGVGGRASEHRGRGCADRPRGICRHRLTNGDVVRVSAEGSVVLGNTGGRPLGIEEYPDGNLLVCDHDRGLLRLDVATGEVEVLVDEVDGKHLHFCSNAVICADGTIYFSSSSDTATWEEFRDDAINHATSGRLTRVRPDGEVTVLRRDLAFANGVVLAPDESYLLVAETIGYRILKFWLKGPRAGEWVDFVTGTPGLPGQHQPVRFRAGVGVAARAAGSGTGFPAPPAPDPAAVGAPGSAAVAAPGRGHRVGAGLRPRREAGPRHQDQAPATLFNHRGRREWRDGLAREPAPRRARPDRPIPLQGETFDKRRDRRKRILEVCEIGN